MDETWSRILIQLEYLPPRLGGHVLLSFTSVLTGVLLSVPMGIVCVRQKSLEKVVVTIANIIQTIPGMALLAIMVFLFGRIGWVPAWVALVLYSLLPVMRNTIAGMKGVDASCLEAARGIGLSDWQTLIHVELPLAAPTIIAGIRTSTAWVVGAATLAYPVGAVSLGNYIFAGLQTQNFVALLFGCVFSAGFALILDGLLGGLERASQRRSIHWAIGSSLGLVLVAVSPMVLHQIDANSQTELLGAGKIDQQTYVQEGTYVVGGKDFTEQFILARHIRNELEAMGRDVDVKTGMGSLVVLQALENGEIDVYVDYSGTLWANELKRSDNISSAEMMIDIGTHLKEEHGILMLGTLGFRNDYVFAMRRQQAKELGIRSLEDLKKHDQDFKAATEIEFWSRPEWAQVQSKYGIQFEDELAMNSTLMYGALRRGEADVIVAYRTDGRLNDDFFLELEDPRFALPPYDGVLLVSERMAEDRAVTERLRKMVNQISTEEMRIANGMVDIHKKPIDEAVSLIVDATTSQ